MKDRRSKRALFHTKSGNLEVDDDYFPGQKPRKQNIGRIKLKPVSCTFDKESVQKFEDKQKRLAQINKRMMRNMHKRDVNKKEFVKSMLEKSGNISNQAEYQVGETLGNVNYLETQQNLKI